MKHFIFLFSIFGFMAAYAQKPLHQYVNPFVGTGGDGHTYPGATVPHGMVQLSPDTRLTGWASCGGYDYTDNFIYGFSHTHLSGTGIPDYADVLLMPMAGTASPQNKIYGSAFSHASEKAHAGFYQVILKDDVTLVELTATERVGYHRYTFSKTALQNIIVDLQHKDEVIGSALQVESPTRLSGYRRSKSWAQDQQLFFVIEFDKPFIAHGFWQNDEEMPASTKSLDGKNVKAFFQWKDVDNITVRVGLSMVSVQGAKNNLAAEGNTWDFDSVKLNAEKKWDSELSKIIVEGDEQKKSIFYTALYHTAVVPNVAMDVNGYYRGMDKQIHKANGFTYYSVFSLWDTYRAAHPLYTIIDKERTRDYIKTFLAHYKEGGRLPVWELASNETECMIGYHSVPVIVDAYLKGIITEDAELALQAMVHSANLNHFGLDAYKAKAFIEADDENESVSRTAEYAYDDHCIALFARFLGKPDIEKEFNKRAQNFKNLLHPATGFLQPRKNGDWLQPFDPREVNNQYTEANGWQYSFYYPQAAGTYNNFGSMPLLETRLDALFNAPANTTGRQQSDITGLIGQYAHGNEPSHHTAYLYNLAGTPYKTQKLVHNILSGFYTNKPDGLIGNEDCGQMSAWYVLSALGIYPVHPASGIYEVGTPVFKKATVYLGKQHFVFSAPAVNDQNYFVAAVDKSNMNSTGLNKSASFQLTHQEIEAGGELIFLMSDKPGTQTVAPSAYPQAEVDDSHFVLNPVIAGGETSVIKNKLVSITATPGNTILYSADKGKGFGNWQAYRKPIAISRDITIRSVAINALGDSSKFTTATYKKAPNNYTVQYVTEAEPMYFAGAKNGLIDGVRGTVVWRRGNWQGFQKTPVEIIIDLQKVKKISGVAVSALQDTRAWIVFPPEIDVAVSLDGKSFEKIGTIQNNIPISSLQEQMQWMKLNVAALKTRYVKITARQYGQLPAWHEGAGGDTHIFIDEIEIK